MEWNKFESRFHNSWHDKIRPFIESEECDEIYKFLKFESKRGKKIVPDSINTFRAFYETPLNEVKCIIIGLCPYHTFKYGNTIADGLLMGCSITQELQPTLEQFYNALEREFHNGLNLNYKKNPDVNYLSKQGVLMLNAALTTEKDKPGSHLEIWEPFMKHLFENVFNYLGVPIIFLGKEASKLKKYSGLFMHMFELSHPASSSYKNTDWSSGDTFRKVNKLIWETNKDVIQWLYHDKPPF